MTTYPNAPLSEGQKPHVTQHPSVALLIDFDNVTLAMRSDLSKELKTLLESDVVPGKITVKRAYADWRRYPQYVVPLSEASVELIFAPAYGSSKKNATDIRMAIDGLELVFVRPEINTFVLLTGDSDFSSLVIKLKEYGKHVIGVGLQESTSDTLVQNCDEYYSYNSLTGLREMSDSDVNSKDPWDLVRRAVSRMIDRSDVMRSDRLKQVMIELDRSFDESNVGFNKFSKFVAEAANRGSVAIRKMENGQYEIMDGAKPATKKPATKKPATKKPATKKPATKKPATKKPATESQKEIQDDGPSLKIGYDLMLDCLRDQNTKGQESLIDSDVKRKMLQVDRSFDETEFGFKKFSKFLLQAEQDGIVKLESAETGGYKVLTVEQLNDIGSMGLPVGKANIVKYLTSSYQGIGKKTAEDVVEAFGDEIFETFETSPHLVKEVCPRRSDKLLKMWKEDVERRRKAEGELAANE